MKVVQRAAVRHCFVPRSIASITETLAAACGPRQPQSNMSPFHRSLAICTETFGSTGQRCRVERTLGNHATFTNESGLSTHIVLPAERYLLSRRVK